MAVAAAAERTGIDEPMIARLVATFYARIREDAILGPIFNPRVKDWQKHEAKIATFWSSVMLQSGTYHGRPMPAHAPLPVVAAHFDHWLKLFGESACDVCPAAQAAMFVERAAAIAQSLEFGIATVRGQILGPGKRLPAP
jgi:hemoglobin